jgi:photosystem II stability/assembly factor-like uncharacterized protein
LYAGTSQGVFTSDDQAASWKTTSGAWENNPVSTLVIDPFDPTLLYAGTSGGLFKSINGGTTWNKVSGLAATQNVRSIVISPTSGMIYIGTAAGVFKSNEGNIWEIMNNGLTNADVLIVRLNLATPETLYAGTSGGGDFVYSQKPELNPDIFLPIVFKN